MSKMTALRPEVSAEADPELKTLQFRGNVPMKRVSFYLPEPLYEDIQRFANERGDSMTGVLRWSLGIGKAIWDEIKSGGKVRVYPASGEENQKKELVFGRY